MAEQQPLVQLAAPQRPARRHPEWLKVRAPFGAEVHSLRHLVTDLKLHTVCQEAVCPNMGECWAHKVATFIILGDICTRGCRYCAVSKGKPEELDWTEPRRVAQAVRTMGLRHAVITSVNRDDLPDGGATIFAETVREIRRLSPDCVAELLIPDFEGSEGALRIVLDAQPEILGHNVETVPRLYRQARGGGIYQVSLQLLRRVAHSGLPVISKTGLMLGLGETAEEIREVMADLLECRVQILTLGQYLRPSRWHLPVARYYHPDEFLYWKHVGEEMGFVHVESGPLVRSSYLADQQFESYELRKAADR
jgi:lipoic acid synthetase